MNAGLLLLHGFLGAVFVAHAFQKLIQFRFSGTTNYVKSLGFRAPRVLAASVVSSELVGGVLFSLGLAIPLAAFLVATTMIVAARTDHSHKGWFITGSGAEYVVTNAVIAVTLAAVGGGRYSLDAVFGLDAQGVWWGAGVTGAALLAAGSVLTVFRHHRVPAAAPTA